MLFWPLFLKLRGQMKKCKKCQIEKESRSFYKKSAAKDGLETQCKSCVNERNKKWVLENRTKSNEIKKRWKIKNRDSYLAQQRMYAIERYKENIEHLREKERSSKRRLQKNKWVKKNTVFTVMFFMTPLT